MQRKYNCRLRVRLSESVKAKAPRGNSGHPIVDSYVGVIHTQSMTKRLQVILQDAEYREIQRAANARHMTIAAWVRQTLAIARRRQAIGCRSCCDTPFFSNGGYRHDTGGNH